MKFLSVIFLCVLALTYAKDCPSKRINSKLICYYSKLTDIDSCYCTHVILPANTDFKAIQGLRQKLSGVKILLTVNEFNQGLVKTVKQNNIDGLELNLKKLDSKNDITEFINTVRTRLGNNLYLALSVPSKTEILAKYYDLKALTKATDLFILQTAFLGASKNVTFHPSRLSGMWDMQNTDSVVDLMTGLGAPLSRLAITAPVQAFKFTLQDKGMTTPGSPALELASMTRSELCEKMSNGDNWTLERDQDQAGPYIFREKEWISFEDATSMDIKAKYARVRGLAGIALKDLSQDHESTKCGGSLLAAAHAGLSKQTRAPRGAVLRSLEREILETPTRPLDTVHVSPYRISRVIDVEGHVHVIRQDTRTEFECSRQGYFVHPHSCGRFYRCVKFDQQSDEFSVFEFDCPAGLAFDARVEVCVWPGSLPDGAPCSGSSEIAPVPKERFVCPSTPGYYADPENCRWFFACLDHGKSGLTAYEFRCPFGLVYDEHRLLCEWPWLVPSCKNGHLTGLEIDSVEFFGGAAKSTLVHGSGAAIVGLGQTHLHGVNAGAQILESYDGLGSLGTVALGGYNGDLNLLKEQYALGYDSAGNLAHTSAGYHGAAGEGQLHLVNTGAHLQGAGFLDGNAGHSTVELHGNSGYEANSAHLGSIHSGQGAVSYSNVQQHNSGKLGSGSGVFGAETIGVSGLNEHNLGLATSGRHGASSISSSANINHGSLDYNANIGSGSAAGEGVLLHNAGGSSVEYHGNHGNSAESGEQVTLLHSGIGLNEANEQGTVLYHGNSGLNVNNQAKIGVIHFGTKVDGASGLSGHASSVNHGQSSFNLHTGSLVDAGKQQESLVTLHGASNAGANLASVEYHGNAGYDNLNIHEGASHLNAGAQLGGSTVEYYENNANQKGQQGYTTVDTGATLSGTVLTNVDHGYSGNQNILVDTGAKLATSTAQISSNAGYNYNNGEQKTVLLNSGATSSQSTSTYHGNSYNSENDKLVLTNAQINYEVPEQKTVLLDSGVKSSGFSVTHHGNNYGQSGEQLTSINEGAHIATSNLNLHGASDVSYENANDHLALVNTGAKVATSTVHLSTNVGHGYQNEGQKQVLLDSGIQSGVSTVEYHGNDGQNYANVGEQALLLNTGAKSASSTVQFQQNHGYNSGENVAVSSVEYRGNAGHNINSEDQVTLLNNGGHSAGSTVQFHQNHGYNSGESVVGIAHGAEQVTLLDTGAKSSTSNVQFHQNHGYNSGESVVGIAHGAEQVTLLDTGAKSSTSNVQFHQNHGYNSGESVVGIAHGAEQVTLLDTGAKSSTSNVQFHQNHEYNSGESLVGIAHEAEQVTLLNTGAKSSTSNVQFHQNHGYNSGASSVQYHGNNNAYSNAEQQLHFVDSGINSGEQYQTVHSVQHTVPVQTAKVVESYEFPAKSTVQLHGQTHSGSLDYNYKYANEAKYKYEQPSVQVTSHVADVGSYDKYNADTVVLNAPQVNYNIQAPTSTSSISYGTKLTHNAAVTASDVSQHGVNVYSESTLHNLPVQKYDSNRKAVNYATNYYAVTPKTDILTHVNLGVDKYHVPASEIKQSAISSSYHYQAPVVQYEQKASVPLYESNIASGNVQSQYYGVQHNQAAEINTHVVQQPAVVVSKFEIPSSTPKYETHYYTKQNEQVKIPVVQQQTVSVTPSYSSQQIHQVNIPIVKHPAPFAAKVEIPLETVTATPEYEYVPPIKTVTPKYETYSGPTKIESTFYGTRIQETVPIQTVTSAPTVVESYSYLPPKQVVSNVQYESKQYLPPKPIVSTVYESSTPRSRQYLPPKPAVFVSSTPKYSVFQEYVQPKQTFEIKKTVSPTVISEYQYEDAAYSNFESNLNLNTQHIYQQQAKQPRIQTETVYYTTQKPYVSSTVSVPVVPVKNIETQFIISTPRPTFVSTIAPIIKQSPKQRTKVVAVTKYDTYDDKYFVSTPKPLYVSTPEPILTETLKPISHLPEFKYYDSRFETGSQKSDFVNFDQFDTKYVVSTPQPIIISTPAPILTETLKPISQLSEFKYYDSRFDTGLQKSNQYSQESVDYSAEFNQFGNYDSEFVVSTAKPAIVSSVRPIQRQKFVSTTPVPLETYGNYDYYDSQYIVSTQKPQITPVIVSTARPATRHRYTSTPVPSYDDSYVVTTARPIITSTLRPIIKKKKIVTTTALPIGLSDYDEYVVSSARPTYEPVKIITPKPKGKTIVRVNDFHPFLTTKLGAQCTCVSNTLKLRKPSKANVAEFDYDYNLPDNVPVTKLTSSGPAYDDNNEEPGVYVVSNADASNDYDYEPKKVIAVTKSPEVYIKSTTNAVQPAPTPVYTIRKKVTSITPVDIGSVTPTPQIYISSTPAEAIVEDVFFKKSVTPLYESEDKSKEEKIAEAVNEGLSLVKSAIKGYVKEAINEETHNFDRYGPGGWRSRDEKLQGSVDCQRAGLFRHPTQCNKFYACHWDCKKQRYTLHVFNCPVHLTFDSTQGACNWPSKGPACTDNTLLPSA